MALSRSKEAAAQERRSSRHLSPSLSLHRLLLLPFARLVLPSRPASHARLPPPPAAGSPSPPLHSILAQAVTDEIRAIFKQLDDDDSGYIEVHELDDMLVKMGVTDEAERKAKVRPPQRPAKGGRDTHTHTHTLTHTERKVRPQ